MKINLAGFLSALATKAVSQLFGSKAGEAAAPVVDAVTSGTASPVETAKAIAQAEETAIEQKLDAAIDGLKIGDTEKTLVKDAVNAVFETGAKDLIAKL